MTASFTYYGYLFCSVLGLGEYDNLACEVAAYIDAVLRNEFCSLIDSCSYSLLQDTFVWACIFDKLKGIGVKRFGFSSVIFGDLT